MFIADMCSTPSPSVTGSILVKLHADGSRIAADVALERPTIPAPAALWRLYRKRFPTCQCRETERNSAEYANLGKVKADNIDLERGRMQRSECSDPIHLQGPFRFNSFPKGSGAGEGF